MAKRSKIVTNAGDNCGVGPDGFEMGNECAKGGGGSGSGSGGSAELKAEVQRLEAVKTGRMPIRELREHAARLSEARGRYAEALKQETAASRERSAEMDRETSRIREGSARASGLKRQIAAADRATRRAEREMDEIDDSGEADHILREIAARLTRNSCQDETLSCVIANAKGKVTTKTIAGEKYYVAPITLIVPGVLSGSQGAGFYSKTENGKNIRAWNNMPLLMGHPKPGEGSGRNPDILNDRYLGFVLEVKNGKNLEGMAYFSETALNTVKGGRQLRDDLLNGRPLEVSTGLDLERVKQKGTHNGTDYDWIAKNYQPDHVAVLTDEKGACSTKDGCGINNAEGGNCGTGAGGFKPGNDCAKGGGGGSGSESIQDREARVQSISRSMKPSKEVIGHGSNQETRTTFKIAGEEAALVIDRRIPIQGGGSDRVVTSYIFQGGKRTQVGSHRSPADAKRAIAMRLADSTKNASNKCDECDEEECNCEPAEDDTTNSISNEEETMKLNKKQRTEVVNSIIENGCGCYTEEERDVLNEFSDERLQEIVDHFEEHTTNAELVTNAGTDLGKVAARRLRNAMSDEEVEEEYKNRQAKKAAAKNECADNECDGEEGMKEEEEDKMAMLKKGTKNAAAPKTMDQWLAEAPEEARSVLNRTFARDKKQRQEFVEQIVNHYVPDGDEEQAKEIRDIHNEMSFERLEALANRLKKADEPQEERSLLGGVPVYEGRIGATTNARRQERKGEAKPLGVPSMEDMFAVINGRKTSVHGDN